jgi:hypothetical protein
LNDYNQQIAARLSRLAATNCTGALPISGYSSGAIYLLDGCVVGAESSRTPTAAGLSGARLTQVVTVAESAIDAALDLLSSRSTCSRFRPAKVRPGAETISISVAELLAEVTRRRRLLQQMIGISADLALTLSPELPGGRVQLTAAEWALVIRIRPRATPRELAWALRRSVFGTTVDVHRLMLLGLLRTADRPVQVPAQATAAKPARRIRPSPRTAASNSTTRSAPMAASAPTTAATSGAASPWTAMSGLTALSFGQTVPTPAKRPAAAGKTPSPRAGDLCRSRRTGDRADRQPCKTCYTPSFA